jgi:NTP pyrophosphatase (non-canonical NTP hydrolase)
MLEMRSIKEWQTAITKNAEEHGFAWEKSDVDSMLLRLHSEVSEASEAARDEDWENFAEELADVFIRLANVAEVMGVDLETEVEKKHKTNIKRPPLHGRKRK